MVTEQQLDNERNKLREVLTALLQQGRVEIEFDKVGGQVRTIVATLQSQDIPEYEKKTDRVKAKRDDQITVVDTEAKMWRNIKLDRIRSFKTITGE